MKITPSKIIAITVILSSALTAFIMLNPETTKDVNIYKYTSGGNSASNRTSTETIISMVEKPVEEEPSNPANGGLGAQGVAGPSGPGGTSAAPNVPGVAPSAGTGVVIPTQNSPTPTNGKILTMQYIYQADPTWGGSKWGKSTIQKKGCIMCASMMLSNFYTGHSYTVDEIINTAATQVNDSNLFYTKNWWGQHGLNSNKYAPSNGNAVSLNTNTAFQTIKKYIDSDLPVMGYVHGHWCNQSSVHTVGSCPDANKAFHKSDGGHYFAIIGYDTKEGIDYIVIHDPAKNDGAFKYIASQYFDTAYIGGSDNAIMYNETQ